MAVPQICKMYAAFRVVESIANQDVGGKSRRNTTDLALCESTLDSIRNIETLDSVFGVQYGEEVCVELGTCICSSRALLVLGSANPSCSECIRTHPNVLFAMQVCLFDLSLQISSCRSTKMFGTVL